MVADAKFYKSHQSYNRIAERLILSRHANTYYGPLFCVSSIFDEVINDARIDRDEFKHGLYYQIYDHDRQRDQIKV